MYICGCGDTFWHGQRRVQGSPRSKGHKAENAAVNVYICGNGCMCRRGEGRLQAVRHVDVYMGTFVGTALCVGTARASEIPPNVKKSNKRKCCNLHQRNAGV